MENKKSELEQLLLRVQKGDEEAFQEFYELWYQKIFIIALSITHHEADAKDATQESMIEIHRSISQLKDLNYFKLWLNRIVLSKCNRIFRKRKAVTMDQAQMDKLSEQLENRQYMIPEYSAHKQSDHEVLAELMKRLPDKSSEILNLMYFEQLNMKEIAVLLNIPENTVKSRLFHAKSMLRKELEKYENKEQCKLNFQSSSLEAALLSACMAKLPFFVFGSKLRPSSSALKVGLASTKAIALATVSVITVGGTLLYNNYQQNATKQENHSFNSPSQLQNMEIKDAKDAYFILMKCAHCEYELNQLDENDRAYVQKIQTELERGDSTYKKLFQKNRGK